MEDNYYVPKYLDEPYKIIFFTLGEMVAFLLPVGINLMIMNDPILGIIFGSILVASIKKIKGKEGHNQVLRFCFWHLPPIIQFKSTPASHVREILG